MKPFIKGKRISLRSITKDDLEIMKDWVNNPTITEYMIMGTFPDSGVIYCTSDSIYDEFDKMLCNRDDIIFSIVNQSDLVIGLIGLYDIKWVPRDSELRIIIGNENYLSNGYGTEAIRLLLEYGFNKLNLHNIHLGVNSEDIRANKCYVKSGFRYDGIVRDVSFRNGKYYNRNYYSILEDEWRKDNGKEIHTNS